MTEAHGPRVRCDWCTGLVAVTGDGMLDGHTRPDDGAMCPGAHGDDYSGRVYDLDDVLAEAGIDPDSLGEEDADVVEADLVTFLRARLDEDEQGARSAIDGPWAVAENGEVYAPGFDREIRCSGIGGRPDLVMVEHLYVTADAEGLMPAVNEDEARHIARWDPARVLAEVEAKRRIIAMHHPTQSDWPLLRVIALPYADHPDYREEWAP